MARAIELANRIERILQGACLRYQREPSIGGVRPDFAVFTPRGETVIVEGKLWDPRGGNTARAHEQVKLYKKATGAAEVFLVLDGLKKNFRSNGVVNLDGLNEILQGYPGYRRWPRMKARKRKPRPATQKRIIFAAMPFEREYDDTYFVAMRYAAEAVGAACDRVDRTEFSGDVVAEIVRLINISIAVIVDLSHAEPNVLYEAGYAHAKRKPTVHICSTPLDDLPFDVRNWNTLEYRRGQTSKLREPLAKRLKSVLT